MNFKLITTLTLVGLLILFIMQNIAIVEVQFLFWSFHTYRSVLIIMTFVVGNVCGWFLHGHVYARRKKTLNQASEKINNAAN